MIPELSAGKQSPEKAGAGIQEPEKASERFFPLWPTLEFQLRNAQAAFLERRSSFKAANFFASRVIAS